MRIPLLLIALLFLKTSLYSQLYRPIDTLNSERKELLVYFGEKTKELETEFKTYTVNDKKIIKRFVNDRKTIFEELLEGNYLLFDKELEGYINGLLQNIVQKNNVNSRNLRIFLSRDTTPNAYSLGDGNFVFTISMLNRLDNEEELSFIVAHELSHYELNHLKKQIAESMRMVNSKEYINKQKEVKKSKYNRFSRSLEQYRELQYGNRNTRRKREFEADSLGFTYFRKVVKNPMNAVSALHKADSLSPSEILKIDLEMLKKHFSSPVFKEEWTTGYDFSKYKYQTGKVDIFGTHKDSLSTHPETKERILKLKKILPEVSVEIHNEKDDFMKLKQKIRFEDIYAHYCLEEYGRGIYLIIQFQNLDTVSEYENLFYSYMLSLFYQRLSDARKTFTFKKYVDDIDYVHFSKEYTLFLTILDNLRSSELQELSNKYRISHN